MTSDPTTGVRKAVAALDQLEEKYKHQPLPTPAITWDKPPHFDDPLPPMPKRPPLFLFLWIPICTGTGCLVALIVVTARQRAYQRVLTSARLPVLRLQEEVASGLVYADTHLNDLPDSPDAKAARQARQIAATLLDQANLQANKVKTQGDLERVQAVLELAKEKTDLCRQRIDAVKESG
jgi:hypothetical protein